MLGALIGQFANTSTLFFFLTWFPDYLVEQKHFTLLKAGIMAIIPYLCALIGTMAGGAGSDWMLRRGVATSIARKAPIITGLTPPRGKRQLRLAELGKWYKPVLRKEWRQVETRSVELFHSYQYNRREER